MFCNFENLDLLTRCLMLDEINFDIITDSLYIPEYLNENGKSLYEILLKKAIGLGDELMLANDIKKYNCLDLDKDEYTDNFDIEGLAQNEFNRFYIRALCKRVIDNNEGRLEICSALNSDATLNNKNLYIGKELEPNATLNKLRQKNQMMPYFINGLSVRIV